MHDSVNIPYGDVLVFAGDFTASTRQLATQLHRFNSWLGQLPHLHKVIVAGNHDEMLENHPESCQYFTNAHYLQDSGITISGLRFWGSPWQPTFRNWAFNCSEPELAEKWSKIPWSTDVLITHGPPSGTLDLARGCPLGSTSLASALESIKPKIHVFGHIHEGYGIVEKDNTMYVNASVCTAAYAPTNPPIVLDIRSEPGNKVTIEKA